MRLGLGIMLGIIGLSATALADESTPQDYQDSLVREALATRHLSRESAPSGKFIRKIVIVPYDVVLDRDPWPGFLNDFHSTTKSYIVEQELLFKVGDTWEQDHIDESARNVRENVFVALAQIIPAHDPQDRDPNSITALVVTKDVWSLRLNTDFTYVGSTLEDLSLEVEEQNLVGRRKRVASQFDLSLATWALGESFDDSRVMSSRLGVSEHFEGIVNRQTGHWEGESADFTVQKPLYSLDTESSWALSAAYRNDIYRLFENAQLVGFRSIQTGEVIPFSYHEERLDAVAQYTLSYGRSNKRNLTMGWRALVKNYDPTATGASPATLQDFSNLVVPRTENAGMAFARFQFFRAEYAELYELDTFALTEDFQLGPNLSAEMRAASRAFGFNSTFLEPIAKAGWAWKWGDDLFSVSGNYDTRYQPNVLAGENWVDQTATLGTHNASPRFGSFRFHTGLRYVRRWNDLDHTLSAIGGDNSMRGYPSNYFQGSQIWNGNFELRTEPLIWNTVHAGAATFLDLGGAANHVENMGIHGSTGLGLRILFPQFNRAVVRVDFGVPLETVNGTPAYFVAKFGQAF